MMKKHFPLIISFLAISFAQSCQIHDTGDSYRNIVAEYTGTVECWRWTFDPHELLYVHTFEPSDKGVHTFSTKITKGGNLVLRYFLFERLAQPSVGMVS